MKRFDQLLEQERIDRYTRLDGYGLGDAEIVWQPETGDAVFRVSKSDEQGARTYALRIGHSERAIDQLRREIAWLTALCRDTDLIVPEPVLAMDGELARRVGISGVPGFRSCVLLRWIRGQPLCGELEADRLRDAGAFVAGLHQHGAGYRWPDELAASRRTSADFAEGISRVALARHADPAAVDAFFAAVERVRAALARLGEGADVAGVIHGDLRLRKIRFRGDEVGALGFDRCHWSYFLADIAMLFAGLRGRVEAEALRAAFLDGYCGLRPISDEAMAQLPAFDALRAIDDVARILSLDHALLVAEPRSLLEGPLAQLAAFVDA